MKNVKKEMKKIPYTPQQIMDLESGKVTKKDLAKQQ